LLIDFLFNITIIQVLFQICSFAPNNGSPPNGEGVIVSVFWGVVFRLCFVNCHCLFVNCLLYIMSEQSCPGCNGGVEPELSIRCDACGRGMHYSCAGILADEVMFLRSAHRRSPHVKLLCLDCNVVFAAPPFSPSYDGDMNEALGNNIFLKYIKSMICSAVSPLKQDIADLREEVASAGTAGSVSPPRVTYAHKLKSEVKSKVVIRPINSKQSSSVTEFDILHNANPINENIKINDVKRVSSGAIVVGCSNELDCKKLKNIVSDKLSNRYQVKELSVLRPQVRLVGISSEISKEGVVDCLRKQNSELFAASSHCELIRYWPTAKNKNVFQANLKVDIDTYSMLLSAGTVIIGLNGCSIYDAVSVLRCYNCSGFHHGSKSCKNKACCPLCGGEHMMRDCKADESLHKCPNCTSLKTKPEGLDLCHAALNVDKCFAYKQALKKLKSDLFGCDVAQ
jgi:hypothetical protein